MRPLGSSDTAPMVGVLYNPAVPLVLDALGGRLDFVEVIPDRLWYDFGKQSHRRFSYAEEAFDELRRYGQEYAVIGHGIGLSLPSAMPLDEELLSEVVATHSDLQYQWYSEHLSMFLVPGGSVPNAQAGMGLPVVLDEEVLSLVAGKVRQLQAALEVPILLENSTIFSAIPEPDLSEPAFFNALSAETGCGLLLDLHNLYANTLNLGLSAEEYLSEINPEIVGEIHLAGGDWLKGHYTDSHSRQTPSPVWEWAHRWAPRFPNLRALTFEYHESYHKRIGLAGIAEEIELMHDLAAQILSQRLAKETVC